MRIILTEKYKSIQSDLDLVLPDFTILTGINGAGKSHLLKAIEENAAKVYDDDGSILTPVRYFNTNSLNPNESYQAGRESYSNEVNSIYYAIQNFIQQRRTQTDITIENHFKNQNLAYPSIIYDSINNTGKSIEQLTQEDIKEFTPLYTNLVQDIFQQNFSAIFKRYSDRYDDNVYNEFLNIKKGKDRKFLTEEQFSNKYGSPPWEFVNRIFDEANIGYTITDPIENDRDFPYTFKLVNKSNGANVNFTDLSSGEKVLMSLTLALYNTQIHVPFPKLLLLDEPDAPLHPSMAEQLLKVIEKVFINEKKVKVIMTTHSPSTIAMASEKSLYVMQKENPRIQKRSQEQIMKLLTDGIPSFSIYADNRRQVFVESYIDALFYSKIYEKLKKNFKNDKSLYFISSGSITNTTGNCEKVRQIVNLLTGFGNQTIYGIIDWDTKNFGNKKIHVLGSNIRYSLENYIYDPLMISNFLMREIVVSKKYFQISEDDSLHDFVSYSPEKLQSIVNILTSSIADNLKEITGIELDVNAVTTVYYLKGISLNIPTWYLQANGHDLEKAIIKSYPALIGKFKDKSTNDKSSNADNNQENLSILEERAVSIGNKIKEEIIKKVFEDLPQFIPVDILNLLQGLLL